MCDFGHIVGAQFALESPPAARCNGNLKASAGSWQTRAEHDKLSLIAASEALQNLLQYTQTVVLP